MGIKYLGFLGGKKQVKVLGGFMIAVFGVGDIFLEISSQPLEPSWILWFFRIGIGIGLILLIAGSLAVDINERLNNK
jgi:hypothetical protein